MVIIKCSESGIEFEAASKRTKQHPRIAALKADANKRGDYAAVMNALTAVRAAGNYTTIEEFVAAVETERAVAADQRHAATLAEAKRRDEEAATRAEMKAARMARNAHLRAHGYKWQNVEIDPYAGDAIETEWVLFAPDGRSVSVQQALDEIERGIEVVAHEAVERAVAEMNANMARANTEASANREARASIADFDAAIAAMLSDAVEVEFDKQFFSLFKSAATLYLEVPRADARHHERHGDRIYSDVLDGVAVWKLVKGTSILADKSVYYYAADPEAAGLRRADA